MPKPISADKKLEWEAKIRQQRESGLSIVFGVLGASGAEFSDCPTPAETNF